jgi:integrase
LIYRRARARSDVHSDPTDAIELPELTSRGKRVPPSPKEVAALLAALEDRDRPLWATAMFAGLRRGEIMALTWENIDLDAGVLHVERSYDPTSQTYQSPKSRHGVRSVPITRTLAPYLRDHLMRSGRREGLVFGRDAEQPFNASAIQKRADAAWQKLERVTLHACRHLYASMSIAAGVNANALCTYMGHSSIAVTYDLYGHLFPGNEAEAAALLDAYLDRELAR